MTASSTVSAHSPNAPTGDNAPPRHGLGILLRILSGVFFLGMSACVKTLSDDEVPLGQMVFFRSFVALVPLVTFLVWCHEWPGGLATRRPFGHLARCVLGCMSMFTSFATLHFLPVSEATLLAYLSPLFVVVLAHPLLGEKVGLERWMGVICGLAGVIVLVGPELTLSDDGSHRVIGVGLGLMTGLFTACALMQVRRLTQTESVGAIAFYFAVVCSVAGLLTLPFGWVVPQGGDLVLLILAGLLGGVAQICMTMGFRYAPASLLAPFEYLSLIWAVVADVALFGGWPEPIFALAAFLVISGALMTARGEIVRAWRRRIAAAE